MTSQRTEVRDRGRRRVVRAIAVGEGVKVVVEGRGLRVGHVHDEFWLPRTELPSPDEIVGTLRASRACPDLFTFAERLPDPVRRHEHHVEWESLAVARFSSYEDWFEQQVNRSVRKHVRKSEREGLVAESVPFSEDLIRGIHAIYNEVPIRQGRPFWHYGKDLAAVRADNASYLERSTFVAVRDGADIVGFLKMVEIEPGVAALMQILSRVSHFEKRPTNALLAKAVETCAGQGIQYLVYGQYAYGTKDEGTLVDFKKNNAFNRIDIPRYYVPTTVKGHVGLRLGLHRQWTDLIPPRLRRALTDARARWHEKRGA